MRRCCEPLFLSNCFGEARSHITIMAEILQMAL
jgi:hypothetical protein